MQNFLEFLKYWYQIVILLLILLIFIVNDVMLAIIVPKYLDVEQFQHSHYLQ